jgi:plasmid stabilization system protein ParE
MFILPKVLNRIFLIFGVISVMIANKAKKFVVRIETEIAKLKKYPQRCPVINEAEFLGIEYRHLVIRNYRIIFKIDNENVYIMRVLHGSRILNL